MANCAWVLWQHPLSTCPPTRAVNLLVPTPKINLSTQVVSLRFISKDIIWAWSSPALFWFSSSRLLVLFSDSHRLVGLWSLLSFQCMTSNWPFLPETLICIQFPSLFEPFCTFVISSLSRQDKIPCQAEPGGAQVMNISRQCKLLCFFPPIPTSKWCLIHLLRQCKPTCVQQRG